MVEVIFEKQDIKQQFSDNITILQAMQEAGFIMSAPCGGHGKCGKCHVLADGMDVLACQTVITQGMHISTSPLEQAVVLRSAKEADFAWDSDHQHRYDIAVDIGTTTVCCELLDGKTGEIIFSLGDLNRQAAFGADVVSRIQSAQKGSFERLHQAITTQVSDMISGICQRQGISPADIGTIGIVGNPCMQQLFFGISLENLVQPPFPVKIDIPRHLPAAAFFPEFTETDILMVPNIFGYIGADTVGCVLSTMLWQAEKPRLVVDIGTNGEMVLGDRNRMAACATAAGPALEGVGITFGMRGAPGAIDHVWLDREEIRYHVIGDQPAKGICGSGLLDIAALLWNNGLVNERGRLTESEEYAGFASCLGDRGGKRVFCITDNVYVTQEDIRQVQMAKGAIAAGIELMLQELNLAVLDVDKVYLAGAFGSFINKESACAIGLLPSELIDRIEIVGNAALEGCRMMVGNASLFAKSGELVKEIKALELSGMPGFPRCFARHMRFS